MLERLLNKKIEVRVASKSHYPHAKFVGIMVAYDDKFIVFDDNSMINIEYIQSIEVIK